MKEIIKAFEDFTGDLIKFSNENVGKNAFNPSVQLIGVLSLLTSVLGKTNIKNILKLIVEVLKEELAFDNDETQIVELKGKQKQEDGLKDKQKKEASLLEEYNKLGDLLDSFDELYFQAFKNYEEKADASNDSFLKFMHLFQNGIEGVSKVIAQHCPKLLTPVKGTILEALAERNYELHSNQLMRKHNLLNCHIINMRNHCDHLPKLKSFFVDGKLHEDFNPDIPNSPINLILNEMKMMIEQKAIPYYFSSTYRLATSNVIRHDISLIQEGIKLSSKEETIKPVELNFINIADKLISQFNSECSKQEEMAKQNCDLNEKWVEKITKFLQRFGDELEKYKSFFKKGREDILQLVDKLQKEIKHTVSLSMFLNELIFFDEDEFGTTKEVGDSFRQHFVTAVISDHVRNIREMSINLFKMIKSPKDPLHGIFLKMFDQSKNPQEEKVLEAIQVKLQLSQENIEEGKSENIEKEKSKVVRPPGYSI